MSISVSLSKEQLDFVEAKVQSGDFSSSSEVISAALLLLETQDMPDDLDLDYLRQAWKEGVESGDYQPLDLEEIKREGRALLSALR
ncbi:type II toxin-antitoxin system ParD family antitoxin [Rhizobium sp.]